MDADQLTCRELVELVTEYLEGALSPEERMRFDDHVERCTGCRNYLDEMRETIRLAGRLEPEHLSREAEEALLRAFRGWKTA